MGNSYSSYPDVDIEEYVAHSYLRGRKVAKTINKTTLFVVIGSVALFEVKRTQSVLPEGTSSDCSKSDIKISIRQLPLDGNPLAESAMAFDDLSNIKLNKARKNSTHSFALNFDREQSASKHTQETNKEGDVYVSVGLDVEEEKVKLSFDFLEGERVDEDAESDCSDGSSFALQISKLAATDIESENETVEKWGEKLAKAIESKIGIPTSVVIKKSSSSKKKSRKNKKHSGKSSS